MTDPIGSEDRFTKYWWYLLDSIPALGQAVVDRIADTCGFQQSGLLGIDDHPIATAEDRPDFLLNCTDYQILCEHKLGAELGPQQLERYCRLTRDKPLYVVLIASKLTVVPPEALAEAFYKYPIGAEHKHLLWEDFYDLILAYAERERLAREFAELMRELGLDPWKWQGWGDPFLDSPAREQFRHLLSRASAGFRGAGRVVRVDPVGLGVQVQRPAPGVRLIHFVAEKSLTPPAAGAEGRVFRARVFQDEAVPVRLPVVAGEVPGIGRIRSFGVNGESAWPGSVKVREYWTLLNEVLVDEQVAALERVSEFMRLVVRDVHEAVPSRLGVGGR